MELNELLAIFDQEQRIDLAFPGSRREVAGRVIRHVNREDKTSFIPYSRMDANTVEAEIDAQVAYFELLGIKEFEWKVYDHDTPADLRQRLAARGFELEPSEALMVLDLENAPGFYWTLELPEIARITSPEGVRELMRMEDEIWETDHGRLGEWLTRDLQQTPEQLSIYAMWDAGRVVSAAWVYFHPPTQFASLWGGSTLTAYRKRGYYTALLVIRAREARQRGFRFLTVDASPMSRAILEKHGFQFLGFSTPCKWHASAG